MHICCRSLSLKYFQSSQAYSFTNLFKKFPYMYSVNQTLRNQVVGPVFASPVFCAASDVTHRKDSLQAVESNCCELKRQKYNFVQSGPGLVGKKWAWDLSATEKGCKRGIEENGDQVQLHPTFTWVLGVRTQVLMLSQTTLHPLSYLLSPKFKHIWEVTKHCACPWGICYETEEIGMFKVIITLWLVK